MAKINDYYQKKQLMEKLSEELAKLEQDQALKSELEFENKVRDLMKKYESRRKTFCRFWAPLIRPFPVPRLTHPPAAVPSVR